MILRGFNFANVPKKPGENGQFAWNWDWWTKIDQFLYRKKIMVWLFLNAVSKSCVVCLSAVALPADTRLFLLWPVLYLWCTLIPYMTCSPQLLDTVSNLGVSAFHDPTRRSRCQAFFRCRQGGKREALLQGKGDPLERSTAATRISLFAEEVLHGFVKSDQNLV